MRAKTDFFKDRSHLSALPLRRNYLMEKENATKFITHPPVAIANYFINKKATGLTVMQVLKLSYIAHGFKLGLDWGAMSNEAAQAWQYGPVFPSIYHTFKNVNLYSIKKPALDSANEVIDSNFDDHDVKVLNLIYELYGDVEAWRLSRLTHQPGTPWHTAYHKNGGSITQGVELDDAEVQQHFKTEVIKKYNVEGVL